MARPLLPRTPCQPDPTRHATSMLPFHIPRRLLPAMIACLVVVACGRAGDTAPAEEADPSDVETIGGVPIDSVYGASYAENLRVRKAEVEIDGLPDALDGLHIAVLSDLNLGMWVENEEVAREAVRRIAESEARVVALLGNYAASPAGAGRLRQLLEPLGDRRIFAVLGHGDRATEELEAAIRGALEQAGASLLHNATARMAIEEDTIAWIGIEPEFRTRPDWRRAEINMAVGGHPSRSIVLSADPRMLPHLPEERHALVLAGGTVCGEGVVPGRARLPDLEQGMLAEMTSDDTGRAYRVEGNAALIACGLGFGFLPIRLAGPPEVLIVELVSVGREERRRAVGDTAAAEDEAPQAEPAG